MPSSVELLTALRTMVQALVQQCTLQFTKLDTDGSGEVSFDELLRADLGRAATRDDYERMRTALVRLRDADTDRNGMISLAEYVALHTRLILE